MFDYCDYKGDRKYLREVVFEFMRGVMRVHQMMMRRDLDGKLSLPVSVSPEYRGAAMNAWGKNASFQLAGIHRLAENLIHSAKILGEEIDPFWTDVQKMLPQAAIIVNGDRPEIGLWDGLTLEESHRHHSHLAGICPFDTIDPEDPQWVDVVRNSISRWTRLGMGLWSGWGITWASMLNSHFNNGTMAEVCLELWRKVFNNEGAGSRHDPICPGFSTIGFGGAREIMQIDGAMGAVTAIQDMLLFSQRGTLKCFYGIPTIWKHAEFSDMPTPGGFLVSGRFAKGKTLELQVKATRKGCCRITVPDAEAFFGKGVKVQEVELEAGQSVSYHC